MELNYKKYGEQGEPLLILHGLFGMLDNWATLGRKFSDHFQVYTIDQRNHGKSPHSQAMNYEIMANDLAEFIEQHQLSEANIIGHSMGGKVAMQFAYLYPHLTKKLIVVDIAPKTYAGNHNHIFEAMESLNLNEIESRKQADEALTPSLPNLGVRQFILKNLARNNHNNYYWRPAVSYIKANYGTIAGGVLGISGSFNTPTLFIRGGKSDYILDEDWPGIKSQFPNATLTQIEDAGHWVHAEKPMEFYEAALNFFIL